MIKLMEEGMKKQEEKFQSILHCVSLLSRCPMKQIRDQFKMNIEAFKKDKFFKKVMNDLITTVENYNDTFETYNQFIHSEEDFIQVSSVVDHLLPRKAF